MSQLVVRPGRNAAREAKRLKEVRKVKGAILWNQRERTKRQRLFQERFETKQSVIARTKWENENIRQIRRQALANAKEDWQLGPLRPNRAVGVGADKYGALTGQQLQKPEIPLHTQKNRNEVRVKQNLEPEYPLVVDDKKYFHIAPEDRVVVIRGKEKGKIGIVRSLVERTHEAIVSGVNMQYYDSDVFSSVGEDMGAKRANEVPIPISDLRLVIPYQITQRAPSKNRRHESKKFVKVYKDVIVDNVVMERHTTGIDPFTGTDYGHAEIPKEHQYDPQTGLPIFHRYIAGTQQRIQWPWEKPAEVPHSSTTHKSKTGRQTWIRRTLGTLRHPIASIKKWTSKDTEAVSRVERKHKDMSEKLMEIEQQVAETQKTRKPKSQNPRYNDAFDITDTTRNIVEGADSMSYTLVAPPFPDTLGEELRGHIQGFTTESRKNQDESAPVVKRTKRVTEQGRIASEIAKAKHAAAQSMKTPMQLRWETEHAKKIKQQKDAPLVSTEELMAALGRHIQQSKAKKSSARLEELD